MYHIFFTHSFRASLVAQLVKNLPAIKVIKVKWDLMGAPFQYDQCPCKRKLGQTKGWPCEDTIKKIAVFKQKTDALEQTILDF